MKKIVAVFLLLITGQISASECPRIISQSPYITHTLQWLGLEKCIVGVSRYDTLDLPRTGGILDPDKLAIDGLMPNVILTTNWITDDAMQLVMPDGAKYYRLNGFDSMAEISANLRLIATIVRLNNSEQKIRQFEKEIEKLTGQISANNKKALLISSCSGSPYSFGKRTWLYELFNKTGFSMVETHDKIRHIKIGNEIEELTTLLNTFQPDILFIFERKRNSRCNLILPKVPVKIVNLDGNKFLHPAPVILQGLEELRQKQASWH